VAIRPPKYNSQGFTLVEMLVVLIIAGIVMGIATPSLLSMNKPLRDGTQQMKSHLSLIRSKAISSSKAYRIRPKYPTTAEYRGEKYQQTPHNFIVEYAANCQVSTYGYGLSKPGVSTDPNRPPVSAALAVSNPNGIPDGWMTASQFDLDLPDAIGVAETPAPTITTTTFSGGNQSFTPANQSGATTPTPIDSHLNWSVCFDNRGLASQGVSFTLKDFQANNRATSALITVNQIGQIGVTTKNKDEATINPNSNGNPEF
jgi:prepilin-type N-terminal cleavage/methylation domain-containing protein